MYNLCFMARRDNHEFVPALFKEYLKKHEAKGIFVTCDTGETATVLKYFNKDEVVICSLPEFMNAHWDEFTVDALSEYEKKYDASPMWKYIYTDRFLINRDYDYCVRTTAGLFAFWEHVFTTYNVDFYYDEVVGTLLTYVAYLVGRKTNTKYYSMLLMRSVGMDLTHHYILEDPFEMMYDMPVDYHEKEVTVEQIKAAEEFLDGFEEKHSKPAFMQFSGRKPKWKASFFILPLMYIRQRFFNPNVNDKGTYIYYKAYEHTLDPIKFYFRYKASRKYYKKADLSKKFVYFPLHLQPEASTIVCAQKYEKQLYFLDNLAKSLPADTVIYAKEHYSFLGSRDNSFYEALKQYPNIELIDPWEDSFALIKNCECVVTLTGTAGQEAMMLRRPVIMAGHILYENAPGVMHLDEIFENYVDAISNWKQPTREEVVRYMAAYMSCARPGNTYLLSIDRMKEENLSLLVDSIHEYFKEIKHE